VFTTGNLYSRYLEITCDLLYSLRTSDCRELLRTCRLITADNRFFFTAESDLMRKIDMSIETEYRSIYAYILFSHVVKKLYKCNCIKNSMHLKFVCAYESVSTVVNRCRPIKSNSL
jgi:hypothetical protein